MTREASNFDQVPNVTLWGGGTGSAQLIEGFIQLQKTGQIGNLDAVISTFDNGGHTGELRRRFGIPAVGDIVKCIGGASASSQIRRDFSAKFADGPLAGRRLGSLLVAEDTVEHGLGKAVKNAKTIARIAGGVNIVPVAVTSHDLVMNDGGVRIVGEHQIGDEGYRIQSERPHVYLDPPADINPEAKSAILNADILLGAPGSFYGSQQAPLLVNGMTEAIASSRAMKAAAINLFTNPGQTDSWDVVEHSVRLESVLGEGALDYIFYHDHLSYSADAAMLNQYAAEEEFPVAMDEGRLDRITAQAIGGDFMLVQTDEKGKHYLRHDAQKLGRQLVRTWQQAVSQEDIAA